MKTLQIHPADNQGFTLVELLLVAAIIMFAGVFLLRLSGSIKGRGQFTTTDNRISVIEAKIKQYYLAHEQLPVNSLPLAINEIPVDISALDLEQRYRLDGWGRPYQYTTGALTGLLDVNCLNTPLALPLPSPVTNSYAASIVSGGPDQRFNANNPNDPVNDDNICANINLSVEAGKIVQKKLKVLMKKVATYDALFAGVDNDGVAIDAPADPTPVLAVDEDPLATANTGNIGCPPTANFFNDPASGLPTLDSIETAMDGGVNAYTCLAGNQLAFHLATYYHLATGFPGGYDIDPWGNPFIWGYINRTLDNGNLLNSMDFQYHKFFSSGPDVLIVDDDIIYNGQ